MYRQEMMSTCLYLTGTLSVVFLTTLATVLAVQFSTDAEVSEGLWCNLIQPWFRWIKLKTYVRDTVEFAENGKHLYKIF